MKIHLVCVGTKMPDWVETGVQEYRKRLQRDFELVVTEVPMAQRGKGADIARAIAKEGEACLRAINRDDYVITLDVKGKALATEQMAEAFKKLRDGGRNVCMLVGGPDGLASSCHDIADASWSLSALTFPHPVVRIVVAEQLYRVWSILVSHPYHRD